MPDRRVLVFDEGGETSSLVAAALRDHRFEVVCAADLTGLDARIREPAPSLIVIAVEAPQRTGFTAFTRARLSCRQVPIVLCTASIPRSELAVHAKQRWRAAAYLDTSQGDAEALRTELARVIRLGPRGARGRSRHAARKAPPARRRRAPPIVVPPQDDRSPRDRFEPIEATPQSLAPLDASDASSEHEVATLEAARTEIARLREQLARARRSLHTSPFSEAFLEVQDRQEDLQCEIARLHGELADARTQIEQHEHRARELDAELRERSGTDGADREREWKAQIEEARQAQERVRAQAQASIERAQERHREALERVRTEQRSAIDALRAKFVADAARSQAEHREALERHAAELAALRRAHAIELDGLRKQHEEQREAERQEYETELQTLEALLSIDRPDGRDAPSASGPPRPRFPSES